MFSFPGNPPTLDQVSERILELTDVLDKTRAGVKLTIEIGRILDEALLGKASPLPLLFPQDISKSSAREIYHGSEDDLEEAFALAVDSFVLNPIEKERKKERVESSSTCLRILEVRAGKGIMLTQSFVSHLMKRGTKFEYHFAGSSAAAEKRLGENGKDVVFKKLDMEADPLEQGFCPEYFDVILAVETIHVAKDVCKALKNLRTLLRPGGVMLVVEEVTQNPFKTFVLGLVEDYWKFEDFNLRRFHPALEPEKWCGALQSAGFPKVEWRPAVESEYGIFIGWASEGAKKNLRELTESRNAWLIFDDGTQLTAELAGKLNQVNRNVVTLPKPTDFTSESMMKLEISRGIKKATGTAKRFEGIIYLWGLTEKGDRDQSHVSLPLLTLLQLMPSCGKFLPKLVVVTQGICNVSDSQVENPTAGTLRGMMGTAMNENSMLNIVHLDLSPTEQPLSQVSELFSDLWVEEYGVIAFREGKRLVPKFASGKIENDAKLELPNGCGHRFQLQLPESRSISDLEFTNLGPSEQLPDDELELEVKAVALNFRDLFTVLKPIAEFENVSMFGIDVSGIVTRIGSKVTHRKVGERIIGVNLNKNLALVSHMPIIASQSIALPPEMTFAEGSTFPLVFSTALFCLVRVAKMKRGQTVLIHTASGGVGLAAIQIARHIGANVIATAGSERKRSYLRNLGIKHVFNSRTTDFGKEILRGRVDVVLNSLTGPGFKEASLDALAQNGHFIEISKLSVWTPEEVRQRRPDVHYEVVDMQHLEDQGIYSELLTELEGLSKENVISPIPYERFDAVNIRGALAYLQKAKHIGKIVCIMPEVKLDKSKVVATTPFFNEHSTYLVTGGQGGVGFEVVKWILRNGGKHVAIASRSKPNDAISGEISTWNNSGHHIETFSIDVGNFEDCQKLIKHIASSSSGFPPLRGVMHAAGVLQDSILENQSWDTFMKTYNAKVTGTWNLHDLTKELELEHFVLFSSMAAILGTPAQANHSASNSFQDAFAHFRRSIGLPALSINWGIWGEVGVATEVDLPGARPISTCQGLHALGSCLNTQTTHIGVANVESFSLLSTYVPKLRAYLDDQKLLGLAKSSGNLSGDAFWSKVDSASNYDEVLLVFKEFIKTTARSVLKFSPDEEIDDDAEFHTLGIDSLMMLEMRNGLQHIFGQRMTLTGAQLKDCSTPELLAVRLIDILNGEDYLRNMPSSEELKQLIREDSLLPQHISPNEQMALKSIKEIEVVLLTGATGNLGPYILTQLSQLQNITKIYCLIRKRGKHSATSRLQSKLRDLEILSEVDMSKVECLEGDISLKRFGLPDEIYEELAEKVEAVVHSAALVLHNDKYWKAPESSRHSVRTANVLGTLKVLEFAVHSKLKYVFYMSALAVAASVNENGHLSEDWQGVGAFDDIADNIGYPVSKHICEQLIRQAVERGVPCTALRIPFLGGDSRTGRCRVETSNLHLKILLHMKLECMPDIYFPVPIIAVDKCAEICIKLFFDERTCSDVIHIFERNPAGDQVIIQIAKEHGINIDSVSFDDFIEKLQTVEDNPFFGPVTEKYNEKFVTDLVVSPSMTCFKKYLENGQDFFSNDKIRKLYPDFEESLESADVVLGRDVEFLKKSGVFKTIGIHT